MRELIEDDEESLSHLDLFADLGGELGGRLEVVAYDWNESKSLREEFKDLPRLSERGHRGRSSANSARATERGGSRPSREGQAARGPTRPSARRTRVALPLLLVFKLQPLDPHRPRGWRPFSLHFRCRGPHTPARTSPTPLPSGSKHELAEPKPESMRPVAFPAPSRPASAPPVPSVPQQELEGESRGHTVHSPVSQSPVPARHPRSFAAARPAPPRASPWPRRRAPAPAAPLRASFYPSILLASLNAHCGVSK
jgi:hypothetical protein